MTARLYCASSGGVTRYCVTDTKEHASEVLGAPAKRPNEEELRRFWVTAGLENLSPGDAADKIGVTRQTIWSWRQRIGGENADPRADAWAQRKAEVIKALRANTVRGTSRELGVPRSTVQKIARLAGIRGKE